MSGKPGPKPFQSLSDVRKRCRVVKGCGCWLWQGWICNGLPKARLNGGANGSVRRWVFQQAHRDEPGFVMPRLITATCGDDTCCSPSHLVPTTGSEMGKKAAAARTNRELWRLRLAASLQASGRTKLTMEWARAIRADARPSKEIAKELDVALSTVNRIRSNTAWREAPTVLGRMAAALGGIAA